MQARIEKALFTAARRLDQSRQRKRLSDEFRVNAAIWQRRAGVPRAALAVAGTEGKPLPAVLLGIRLGTCDLSFQARLDGHPANISVSRDEVTDGLRITARQPEPFGQFGAWPEAEILQRRLSIEGRHDNRPVLLANVSLNALGHDSDLDGYATGHVSTLIVGDEAATSTRWSAYLLGLDLKAVPWQGDIRGTKVSLHTVPPEPRWTGLAARARKIRQNRFWSAAEWATWHRSAVPADLPPLVRADLEFSSPVNSEQAELSLLEDVCWVLDLYAGRRLLPIGTWNDRETCGRLTDLGRPLRSRQSIVASNVLLRDYLNSVLPVWNGMGDDESRDIKIGIAVLYALGPDLEAAVVVGAMGLEHLASALLPPPENGYDLKPSDRRQILSRLRAAAEEIAPGSDWIADLPRVEGNIFHRPASDRIGELCESSGVEIEEGEIKAYASVRNPVTHGRIPSVPLDEKIRAMLFERHAIGVVLLRKLSYQGSVYDTREAVIRD
jgi:hypothetical protein